MVVPFPPGPALDLVARLVGIKLGEALGQNVVTENRTGANGMIGSSLVARAPPDGNMLLMTTASTHVTAVHLMKNLSYDPIRDFTPIVAAVEPVTCLVVSGTLPVNSVPELIAYAKAHPGELSYGSSGVGSVFHLMGELFNQTAGVKINHVPYRGVAPALQDVIAGHIPMAFLSISNVLGIAEQSGVKILAVLEPRRFALRPQIPSMSEVLPAFRKPSSWFGTVRAGRAAGADHRAAQCRNPQGAQCARHPAQAQRQRDGGHRRHAGGIQGADRGWHRALRRDHQGRRDPARIGERRRSALFSETSG